MKKKSIFLAYCLKFDDKLQELQNNAVLGWFLDEKINPYLRGMFWL